jgi:hypothetical protein
MASTIDSNRPCAWLACVTKAMVLTMVCSGCNAVVEAPTELLSATVETGEFGAPGTAEPDAPGAAEPDAPGATELRLRALEPIGVYETGVYNESAAEITAYDPGSKRLFVVNGSDGSITVLDLSDPRAPIDLDSLDLSAYGAAPLMITASPSRPPTARGIKPEMPNRAMPSARRLAGIMSAATVNRTENKAAWARP